MTSQRYEPSDVLAAFCLATQWPLHLLAATAQTREVTRARHECMWLMRDLTAASGAQIGQLLGGRHFTTVDEATAKVSDRLATDPEYRGRLRRLRAEIVATIGTTAAPPDPTSIRSVVGILADENWPDDVARRMALALLAGAAHGA